MNHTTVSEVKKKFSEDLRALTFWKNAIILLLLFAVMVVGSVAFSADRYTERVYNELAYNDCEKMCAAFFPVGSKDYYDCVYCCTHDCD